MLLQKGGRYAILAGGGPKPLVDVFAAAHPTSVKYPAEIETVSVPSIWLLAEKDSIFQDKAIAQAQAILSKKQKERNLDFEIKQ